MQVGDRVWWKGVKERKPGVILGPTSLYKDGCQVFVLDEGRIAHLRPEDMEGPDPTIDSSVILSLNVDPDKLTKQMIRTAVFQGILLASVVLSIPGFILYLLLRFG
jgi:hypothetical protein